MQESETDYKFFAVLLSQLACLFKFGYHFGKVMMPAEIKVHYFFYFTINHLGDVEVVRFLVFVHNFVFYCLLFVVKRRDTGIGFMDKCKKKLYFRNRYDAPLKYYEITVILTKINGGICACFSEMNFEIRVNDITSYGN